MTALIPFIVRVLALFGVSVSPFIVGVGLAGLTLAGAGIAYLHASNAGYAKAANACQQKALEARNAALTIERNSLNERATRAEQRADELASVVAQQETDNRKLIDEVKVLQSTKQGARRDPNALIDDQCNITDTGRRRLR